MKMKTFIKGLALAAVFSLFACQNDFTVKSLSMIAPAPDVPAQAAVYWDTDEILLHESFDKGFFPTSINGVINNQNRQVWFSEMNDDDFITFSPDNWSSVIAVPDSAPNVDAIVK
ncbi:MAG: hypothetical protein LBV52_06135, partial [Spirochaetaceae bacterium]|nr:hypothetical protein [Spirochaetaceae bacterium]